jgi:hypothetical protein
MRSLAWIAASVPCAFVSAQFNSALAVYGQDNATPAQTLYDAGAWGTESDLLTTGAEPKWVVARACPTRDEATAGVLVSGNSLGVAFRRDGAWGSFSTACGATGTDSERPYDLAYEQSSGEGLIVYWSSNAARLGWRTWSTGSVSAETTITALTQQVKWVRLEPKPGGNEILMLALDKDSDLHALVWDGSAWGSATLLHNDASDKNRECFDIAYEATSGRALVVYGVDREQQPRYRTLTAGVWSAEQTAPGVGGEPRWVRLASRPGSNDIAAAYLDDARDINANVWGGSGSSWGVNTECATRAYRSDRRAYDLCFQRDGATCVLAYAQNNVQTLITRTWTPTGGWSGEAASASMGNKGMVVAVTPGLTDQSLFVLASDESYDLNAFVWGGTSLGTVSVLETDVGSSLKCEPFMMAGPVSAVTAPVVRVTNWKELTSDE